MVLQEIVANLWLSDFKTAMDKKLIKKNGINIIVNCSKNLPFIELSNIKKHRLSVDDNNETQNIIDMNSQLEMLIKQLSKAYLKGNTILLYCFMGRQRSATVAACFLLYNTDLNDKTIIKLIQSKEPLAFKPQINFSESIKWYSNKIKNINK